MPPRAALLPLLALFGIFSLPGCASTPSVPVPEGSRIVVRLYDARSGVELALANESYPELQGLYSRSRSDASLKLAPDELIGQLLYSLEATALEAYGVDGRPLQPQGPDSYLFVEQNGRERLFHEPSPAASVEERRAFTHVKFLMSEYYQHVGSKQYVENPDGADIFRKDP